MNFKNKLFRLFFLLFLFCSTGFSVNSDNLQTFSGMSPDKLAPQSLLSSLHFLLLDIYKNLINKANPEKKGGFLSSKKFKFSLSPSRDAWTNLQTVKKALGTPQEYRAPLTLEAYDRIMNPEVLLALAKSFVQFFPAYDKWGKIKRVSEKELKSLVDSLNWSAEKRAKAFMDKVELQQMIDDMKDESNPDTMGGAWARGVWRAHMILYKKNIVETGNNLVFPLKVFLHELAHCLPGYKDTHFNDTLAIAFLAFMGINTEDIYQIHPDENFLKYVKPKEYTPFDYKNIEDEVYHILYFTRKVPAKYSSYLLVHPFISTIAKGIYEPYSMNRNLGYYIANRFHSVLKQLLKSENIDTQTAYMLAREDMLETLRLIYSQLLNYLASGYFRNEYGRTKDIIVKEWTPSAEKLLFTAA